MTTIFNTSGSILVNPDWTTDFLTAIAEKESGRGSTMTYQEKQGDWLLYRASVTSVEWDDLKSRPDLSRTEIFTFAIGAAPALTNGSSPDEVFANGSVFQSDLLIGAKLQIRLVGSGIAPQAGGYSYVPGTGTITTDSPVNDSNMFILAVFAILGSEPVLTTESGQFITTEDGFNILLG